MILSSPLYDRDPNYQYGDYTYKWSDPNTDADHFQSFASTGMGLIDQSIFSLIRGNDKYTLGNYMSFIYNAIGQSANPDDIHTKSVKNNLRKNLDNLAANASNSSLWTISTSVGSSPAFYNAKYSPDGVYNLNYDQRFAREYQYNDIVLVPVFYTMVYDTVVDLYAYTYEQLMEAQAEHPVAIAAIYIEPYIGDINSGAVAQRQLLNGLSPYAQFAGTVPYLKCTRSDSVYQQVRNYTVAYDSDTSGVFEFAVGTQGYKWCLFETVPWRLNNKYFSYAPTNIHGFVIPYDISLFEVSQWADPNMRLLTTSVQTAVTMVDRLGYNWAKNRNSALTAKTGSHCDDPNIRCAVIDPDTNTITSEVLEGEYIAYYADEHPESNFNWGSGAVDYNGATIADIRTQTDVDQPTIEPVDEIDLNIPVIATTGGTSVWIMSQLDMDLFFTDLWDPDGNIFDDIVKGAALLGENPMDSVISLRMYPLNLQQYCTYENKNVCFGRTMLPSMSHKFHMTSSNIIVLNLGTFNFNDFGMYKDFRDYEPYSDYAIYIPFCGIIPLSAIECVNTTIGVKMIIDLCTGSCTGVLFTNNVPYKYLDGMIGIDVPVTGRNLAGYANTVLAAALGGGTVATRSPMAKKSVAGANEWGAAQKGTARLNLAQFSENISTGAFASEAGETAMLGATGAGGMALGAAAPAAMGLAFGVAGAAIGGAAAALSTSPAVESVGSNTPATSLAKPLSPYLIVRRSDSWIPSYYDKLYGRPCQQGGIISDFVGFCTFGNIKIESMSYATSEEKVLISELLTKGVFL